MNFDIQEIFLIFLQNLLFVFNLQSVLSKK